MGQGQEAVIAIRVRRGGRPECPSDDIAGHYYSDPKRHMARGSLALLAGLLASAVEDLATDLEKGQWRNRHILMHGKSRGERAMDWFRTEGRWLNAFGNICDYLEIDARAFRRVLVEIWETKDAVRAREIALGAAEFREELRGTSGAQ